jgi:hypothetical protein
MPSVLARNIPLLDFAHIRLESWAISKSDCPRYVQGCARSAPGRFRSSEHWMAVHQDGSFPGDSVGSAEIAGFSGADDWPEYEMVDLDGATVGAFSRQWRRRAEPGLNAPGRRFFASGRSSKICRAGSDSRSRRSESVFRSRGGRQLAPLPDYPFGGVNGVLRRTIPENPCRIADCLPPYQPIPFESCVAIAVAGLAWTIRAGFRTLGLSPR